MTTSFSISSGISKLKLRKNASAIIESDCHFKIYNSEKILIKYWSTFRSRLWSCGWSVLTHRPITRAACDFRSAGCIHIEGLPASSLLRSCAGVRLRISSRYWPLAHVILSALAVFARDAAFLYRPIARAACGFCSAGCIRIEGLPASSLEPASVACGPACTYQ